MPTTHSTATHQWSPSLTTPHLPTPPTPPLICPAPLPALSRQPACAPPVASSVPGETAGTSLVCGAKCCGTGVAGVDQQYIAGGYCLAHSVLAVGSQVTLYVLCIRMLQGYIVHSHVVCLYTHTHTARKHTHNTHTLAGRQTHELVKLVCVCFIHNTHCSHSMISQFYP